MIKTNSLKSVRSLPDKIWKTTEEILLDITRETITGETIKSKKWVDYDELVKELSLIQYRIMMDKLTWQESYKKICRLKERILNGR